jgi:hypothetical protein
LADGNAADCVTLMRVGIDPVLVTVNGSGADPCAELVTFGASKVMVCTGWLFTTVAAPSVVVNRISNVPTFALCVTDPVSLNEE